MWRLWTLFAVLTVGFFLIITRLFYWQVLQADRLKNLAAGQYFLELTIPATRGSIYSSGGLIPLVVNQPAFLVYAQPPQIPDIKKFVNLVAPILDLDKSWLEAELVQSDRVWVPLGHKVNMLTVEKLKDMGLTGLGFEKEPTRMYPEASTAAHLLGFVGSDVNGNDQGYFGLEGYYDRQLRGRNGLLAQEKDARGNPILVNEIKRLEPENGRSLTLWLDIALQRLVEKRLKEGMSRYGAKEGSVVVMDPATGGILAMASVPNYDPASYSAFDKVFYKNPVVANAYEPGSTFKVLAMAAAIEEKLITPNTIVEESGPVVVGQHTIRTWNNQYRGPITMTKVLEYSSNVGMVEVARKLGKEKLLSYIRRFGFGELSGIDLEEETAPDLRPEDQWYEIDFLTAAFGQGIAVTPIQMVVAVSALASDGWLVEPHVVSEIRSEGKAVKIKSRKVRQVVSASTARIVTEMMVAAVDNGEAKWAKPAGYRIAGKTGTAQIPVAGHYDEEKTIASFVGFAPADKPRFVMLVTLREPTSSPWGSETAAPLFFNIARDLFNYWGVPPQ